MIFQYASDLHVEFVDNFNYLMSEKLIPVAPYLILAGDIDIIKNGKVTRPEYFQYLSDNWKQVYIIPGNHEFYKEGDVSLSFDLDIEIMPNVRYINHQVIHIEGVDFLFSTLWSGVKTNMIHQYIADFNTCQFEDRRYTVNDHYQLYLKSLKWLKGELSKEKKYPRVVVSHFVPCQQANGYPKSSDRYIGPIISSYFVADLEVYINSWDIDYWIYGHNHWDKDVDALGVKFRSNQFGYSHKMEHIHFDFKKVIEI